MSLAMDSLRVFFVFLLFPRFHFSKTLSDSAADRAALLSFRTQVIDPENALSTWSENSTHCSWFGVSCPDNRTAVVALQLTGLGLSGTMPPQLSNLSSLEFLDLSNNSFYGRIPSELTHLTSLQYLILSQNLLNGSIPEALFQNRELQAIMLGSNQLTGTIPTKLRSLKKLRILDLSDNKLSGVIPPSVGNLSSLTNFSLAENQLTGEIPREIGHLRNLLSIQLSVNNITGEIPDSLYNLSSLVFLSLTQNNFTGRLRVDFGFSLPKLSQLYLAGNQFYGQIPVSISNLTELQFLELSGNHFSGSIPLFGKLAKLVSLKLGENNLSSDTRQNLQLFDSLTNCTKLETLELFHNELSGELPDSVGNLSTSLLEFCVNDNRLTGRLPRGIEILSNLISLALERNFFTGEIPGSIGSLRRLVKLSVQQNRLSGEVPDVFGNLSMLSFLTMGYNQFSGTIPPSIGRCRRLQSLDLTGNRLSGSIPKEIFGLSGLNYLVVAENSLTGAVPDEVKNLQQVLAIELSNNKFSGNIPDSIGKCSTLQYLSMARNNLSGSIPDSLGDLASLETLDLSLNNLSGLIPKELGKLGLLKNLNLSFNHLEGEVPTVGIFTNTTGLSLQGNNLLCSSDQETSRKFEFTQCVTKKGNKNPKLKFIILGVCLGIFLLALFCFVLLIVAKKKKTKATIPAPMVKGLPPVISYAEIRVATADFADENLIGKGGSGYVYKGLFNTGENGAETVLAIKVLNLKNKKASKSFNAECEALRNARHRNLVKVVTSCSSIDHKGDDFKALVMEFMPKGSLYEWLYASDVESSSSSLTLLQRLNIIIDVASALDYLHHDCDPPIVHCDLKPGNILLDDDMTAHVADFGLARFLYENQSQETSTIGLKGSIGYIPPEYGFGGEPSTSGDVYSFGILLLEVFIAKKPTDQMFKEGSSLNAFALAVNENRVTDIVDPRIFHDNISLTQSVSISNFSSSSGTSSSSGSSHDSYWRGKSENCAAAAIRIGLACAAQSSKDRLKMREALKKLNDIKKSLLGL